MMIGGRGIEATAISCSNAASITVRGKDLSRDIMGRFSFSQYFFLLITGREPTADQVFFLDLLLVAIAEHGLVPTNQVARMTFAADPGSLQGAVAAGILGCGSVVLGTADECGKYLQEALRLTERTADRRPALRKIVEAYRESGRKIPGFGHPLHKPLDPRTERILQLADEHRVSGRHVGMARQTREVVHELWEQPLTMNVSMMIAAVLLDLDFPGSGLKSGPILARTARLVAHLAEEGEMPIGFALAGHAAEAIQYCGEKA